MSWSRGGPGPTPAYVIGKGKVGELSLKALAYDVNLLVFDHELSPSRRAP
jgi:50S ribosomal subunit-associated GTPase HflX